MTDQPPGQPAGHLYRLPVTVQATAYVLATSPDEARRKLYDAILEDVAVEIGDDSCGWISGRRFDDADLPIVSLSPATTIRDYVAPLEQVEAVDP